jgi:hypothetical protein
MAFPFSSIGEYLDAGDNSTDLLMRIPRFGRQTEVDLRNMVQEVMNNGAIDTDISEYHQVPLSHLHLSDQYMKLIKRMNNIFNGSEFSGLQLSVETVGDVARIKAHEFGKYQGVGREYVDTLIELKRELPLILDEYHESAPKIKLSLMQLEMPIAQLAIPVQYQKIIRRILSVLDNVVTVQDLINVDPVSFANLPTVGKLYVESLIELQKKLPSLLDVQMKKFASLTSIEFNDIDNALITDIESYLWTLDETKMDIALSRWGFNQEHETLEEVASRHNLTRERIRQVEKLINANLPLQLTIPSKILWANIREKMSEDLTLLLPNLAKCFATVKLFYDMIEFCCQVEAGSISKIIFTKIRPEIINSLFCSTPSPVAPEIIINELMSSYGYDKASAIHGIKQLENLGKIELTMQGVYPKKLARAEAVAHVLTSHPEGLPWKDIARIVNKKGCSATQMDEARSTHGFSDSEYVYLCAKGTYRNLLFLNLDQFDIPKVIQHLIDYFKQSKLTAANLHDYYYQTKGQRCEVEYFVLRHIVREYGDEYGIYFGGKSNVDSISLDADSKRITQADVIIKVLNETNFAMTKQEIAERLRSKSINHASFYLSNLMDEGKVVRVDKMVYTTPEKAFGNIDTRAIMQVIRDILNIKDIVVEADIFREYVNMELNLSYSKYIYAALVSTQLTELGWYRHNMLFSKNPIPYKNLLDMCKQLCNPKISNTENIKILQQVAWLTDPVTTAVMQQWRLVLSIPAEKSVPAGQAD